MQFLFGWIEFHHQFGFVRVGGWKFRWRKLLHWQSPLMLRWCLRRLRLVSPHPYRDFAWLLWPWPRRWPCPPLPPPPRVLLADPAPVLEHYYHHCHVQRQFPLWARRDTPERAFFRLYEALCAADDVMIGYATEYLFFRPQPEWALHLLADPRTLPKSDTETATETDNAERLAVMARLAVALEQVFNWRLKLGLRRDGSVDEQAPDGTPAPWEPETRPAWADEIPGLPELFVLSSTWDASILRPGDIAPYNIIIHGGALRTV